MTVPRTDLIPERDSLRMTYEQGWRKVWETVDPGTWLCGYYNNSSSDIPTQTVLYQMKRGLISPLIGRWTVLASCGKAGTGSLVASAGDNWLSASDLSRNTTGTSPRSWILLRSPSTYRGTFYLLMDWWGSARSTVQFYFTKSCPDYSSPATNARPPATGNEWTHLNSLLFATSQYGGIRSYLVKAHDGSFVFACALGSSGGAWHRFQAGILFNILQAGSSPSWDTTQAVSAQWTGAISQNSQIPFKTLHRDGTDCTLHQVQLSDYESSVSTSVLYGAHTDDIRGTIICYPPQLVSIDTGKKCWRGILEDLSLPPNQIAEGTALFKNGGLKGIRIGSWIVPATRNLVLM